MSPIDPRFDPRFQRGYTGEGAADAAGAEPVVRRKPKLAASARRIEPPEAAPVAFAAENSWSAQATMEDQEVSDPSWILDELGLGRADDYDRDDYGHDDGIDATDLGAEALAQETWAKHRNPWMIALWVVSFALIIGPAIAYWNGISNQAMMGWSGAEPPPAVVLFQLTSQFMPYFLVVGGAGVIGAISLHAVEWSVQRRAEQSIEDESSS